ncbi:hypothetical protein [Pedobacter sp. Leaf132]|uniref:hypothetical protein n=1 Tax=Pedobacter sp. Leaf132 TaxID=2876557 RepID=UPI001E405547|nr:hypothetical protein [Pedobacter sp. Leaf132]
MKTLALILLMFIGFSAFAQKNDSTRVRKSFNSYGLLEKAVESKSKPHVRNGSAEVFYNDNLIATGLYKDNERFGRWRFFKYKTDTIAQIYNYSSKKIEFNLPDNTQNFFVDSLKQGDKLILPVKIGSMIDIYKYLAMKSKIPQELAKDNVKYNLLYIIYINKQGKITKLETEYLLNTSNKTFEITDKSNAYLDFDFVPAILNGKAVESQMMLKGTASLSSTISH